MDGWVDAWEAVTVGLVALLALSGEEFSAFFDGIEGGFGFS